MSRHSKIRLELKQIEEKNKKLEGSAEDLKKSFEELKEEILVMRKVQKEQIDAMREANELFKGTFLNAKKVENGEEERYVHGKVGLSYDKEKVEKTLFGKIFAHSYDISRKMYSFFPVMGYAGTRELSRGLRGWEQLASSMSFFKGNDVKFNNNMEKYIEVFREIYKEKHGEYPNKVHTNEAKRLYGNLSAILQRRGVFKGFSDEDIKKVTGFNNFQMKGLIGLMKVGKGIGVLLSIFMAVESIFIFMKVITMLMGSMGKMMEGVLKIFKMSFSLALKPIVDMFSLLLLPIAVMMLMLSARWYKFLIPAIRGLAKWSIGVIRWFRDIHGVSKSIMNFIKPIGDGIVAIAMFEKRIFTPIFKIMSDVFKIIYGIFKVIYDLFFDWKDFKKDILNLRGVFEDLFSNLGNDVIGLGRWIVDSIMKLPSLIANAIMSIVRGWGRIGSNVVNAIGSVIGFQSGGYISDTGLYLIHGGEVVIPRNEVNKIENRENKSSNVVNITVNVNGSNIDVDTLVSEIERRMRGVVSW